MEKIKLSQLNTNTPIAYGSKKILACAERLFLDIYEGCRKRKVIAIIDNKNYEVEYDVKREQIKEVKRKILLENGYDDLVRDTIDQKKDKILSQIGNLRCQVEEALDEENENHWTQPIKDIAQSIAK